MCRLKQFEIAKDENLGQLSIHRTSILEQSESGSLKKIKIAALNVLLLHCSTNISIILMRQDWEKKKININKFYCDRKLHCLRTSLERKLKLVMADERTVPLMPFMSVRYNSCKFSTPLWFSKIVWSTLRFQRHSIPLALSICGFKRHWWS